MFLLLLSLSDAHPDSSVDFDQIAFIKMPQFIERLKLAVDDIFDEVVLQAFGAIVFLRQLALQHTMHMTKFHLFLTVIFILIFLYVFLSLN